MNEMNLAGRTDCPKCGAKIEIMLTDSDRINNFLTDEVRKMKQLNRKRTFSSSMRSWFWNALFLHLLAMLIFPYPDVIMWTSAMSCLYGFIYVFVGFIILFLERNYERKMVKKEIKEMTEEI